MKVENMDLDMAYKILRSAGFKNIEWVLFKNGAVRATGFVDRYFLKKFGRSPVQQVNIFAKKIILSNLKNNN